MRFSTYVVGVDGGGSKTDIAFSSINGVLLGYIRLEGTRLEITGVNKAVEIIWGAIVKAMHSLRLPKERLRGVALGLGGLDSRKMYDAITKKVEATFPPSCLVSIWNDAQIGLYSGTFGRPGVCVVAGTGSLIAGMNERGEWKRVGGWGSVFGDEGSAYSIGRLAIRACLRAADGTAPPTALSNYITYALGIGEIEEVVSYLTWNESFTHRVAALAPLVDKAAQEGDCIARKIIESEAVTLADDTVVLINSLEIRSKVIPVILVGGCFNSVFFRNAFVQRVTSTVRSQVVFVRPPWPPVLGALVAALESIGKPLSQTQARRLGESFLKVKKENR